MMYYTFDTLGRFAGESQASTERSTTTAPAQLSQDYNWNGVDWVYAPNVQTHQIAASAPSQEVRSLTKLEYMDRFTDAELAGIYTAAKTVIQVEIWLEKFKLAASVDLDDPRTLAGLQAMEAAGLLEAGRAAEIAA